ncbi:UNKNOWN [Stylonychia lemnae]|uniref:TLDc domain-containing protein n=1 Tax=Stylonychia lemnae TaxID=5949 RepID=A0A078A5J7_STYLE|nr:UNKNOWN [Stylonychia lemnae]|eukprot:CDW76029.1 UNKNOWN [Stylonychia lemnae]
MEKKEQIFSSLLKEDTKHQGLSKKGLILGSIALVVAAYAVVQSVTPSQPAQNESFLSSQNLFINEKVNIVSWKLVNPLDKQGELVQNIFAAPNGDLYANTRLSETKYPYTFQLYKYDQDTNSWDTSQSLATNVTKVAFTSNGQAYYLTNNKVLYKASNSSQQIINVEFFAISEQDVIYIRPEYNFNFPSQNYGKILKYDLGNVYLVKVDNFFTKQMVILNGEPFLIDNRYNLSSNYDSVKADYLSVAYDGTLWGIIEAQLGQNYFSQKLAYFNKQDKKWYSVSRISAHSVAALNRFQVAYIEFSQEKNIYISEQATVQPEYAYVENQETSYSVNVNDWNVDNDEPTGNDGSNNNTGGSVDSGPQVKSSKVVLNDTTLLDSAGRKYVLLTSETEYRYYQSSKLCFKATRDGFSSNKFHENCDKRSSYSITLVKSTDGKVFGGYSTKPWRADGHYSSSYDSLVFSVDKAESFEIKSQADHYAVYDHIEFGPSFGTRDLVIDFNLNKQTTLLGNSFEGSYDGDTWEERAGFLAGNTTYEINDVEVHLLSYSENDLFPQEEFY